MGILEATSDARLYMDGSVDCAVNFLNASNDGSCLREKRRDGRAWRWPLTSGLVAEGAIIVEQCRRAVACVVYLSRLKGVPHLDVGQDLLNEVVNLQCPSRGGKDAEIGKATIFQ